MAAFGEVTWTLLWNQPGNWTDRLRARVTTELQSSAENTLSIADGLVPRKTGELASTGKVVQLDEFNFTVSYGEGLPDMRAPAQEFGTINVPAQPYLFPAFVQASSGLAGRLAMTTQGRVTIDNVASDLQADIG